VKKFKEETSFDADIKRSAVDIYNKYLSPNSRTPVNIDGNLQLSLSSRFEREDISRDMFDEAQLQIYVLMKTDVFIRFQNYLEEHSSN
jgi:hypothetical protein